MLFYKYNIYSKKLWIYPKIEQPYVHIFEFENEKIIIIKRNYLKSNIYIFNQKKMNGKF